jgi:hypothetical protein
MNFNIVLNVLIGLFIYDLIMFLINVFLRKQTNTIDLYPKKSFKERLNIKMNQKNPDYIKKSRQ